MYSFGHGSGAVIAKYVNNEIPNIARFIVVIILCCCCFWEGFLARKNFLKTIHGKCLCEILWKKVVCYHTSACSHHYTRPLFKPSICKSRPEENKLVCFLRRVLWSYDPSFADIHDVLYVNTSRETPLSGSPLFSCKSMANHQDCRHSVRSGLFPKLASPNSLRSPWQPAVLLPNSALFKYAP